MHAQNVLVALRTHYWNENIEAIAQKFKANNPNIDFVVLVDETQDSVEVGNFEKVPHTKYLNAFSDVVLHETIKHKNNLWFNADYALYALRKAKPLYKWYIMFEYDALLNFDVEHMMEQVDLRNIDFVAHKIVVASPQSNWFNTSIDFAENPIRAFFPVMLISGRGIDHVLHEKIKFLEKIKDIPEAKLPFCEFFIPTALQSMNEFKYAELSDFVELVHYHWKVPVDIHDPVCARPGSVAHPVFGGEEFLIKVLKRVARAEGISGLLNPQPMLMQRLRYANQDLIAKFIKEYLHAAIESFLLDRWLYPESTPGCQELEATYELY